MGFPNFFSAALTARRTVGLCVAIGREADSIFYGRGRHGKVIFQSESLRTAPRRERPALVVSMGRL